MRWVERADKPPHHCAVFPHLGSAHRDGYYETESTLIGPSPNGLVYNQIYVSVVAVREMARLQHWHSPEEMAEAVREVNELSAQLAKVEGERDAYRGQVEAVHTLRQAGFTPAKKPGRKPKEPTAA